MKKVITTIALLLALPVMAWDGYDWTRGSYVEIDRGQLVRPGYDIDVYDYGTGTYRTYEVDNIHSCGTGVEVDVYDWQSGEYRTFDMD